MKNKTKQKAKQNISKSGKYAEIMLENFRGEHFRGGGDPQTRRMQCSARLLSAGLRLGVYDRELLYFHRRRVH